MVWEIRMKEWQSFVALSSQNIPQACNFNEKNAQCKVQIQRKAYESLAWFQSKQSKANMRECGPLYNLCICINNKVILSVCLLSRPCFAAWRMAGYTQAWRI